MLATMLTLFNYTLLLNQSEISKKPLYDVKDLKLRLKLGSLTSVVTSLNKTLHGIVAEVS